MRKAYFVSAFFFCLHRLSFCWCKLRKTYFVSTFSCWDTIIWIARVEFPPGPTFYINFKGLSSVLKTQQKLWVDWKVLGIAITRNPAHMYESKRTKRTINHGHATSAQTLAPSKKEKAKKKKKGCSDIKYKSSIIKIYFNLTLTKYYF